MDPSFSFDRLKDISGGDSSFEEVMLQHFLDGVSKELGRLRQSFDAQNPREWRDSAHALKGLFLNLGAGETAKICHAAQEHNGSDYGMSGEKRALFDKIARETADLCGFIRQAYPALASPGTPSV